MKKKSSNKSDDKILQRIESLASNTNKGFEGVRKEFEGVHKEIENLALITGKGFEDVHKRLDDHDKKFENIDKKFVDIDGQFKIVVNELMRLGDEVKDVKGMTMSLVQSDAAQDKENRKIIFRLDRLENRAAAR